VPDSQANSGKLTVGQLEGKLFELFPKKHCEDWDMSGLLVGNPEDEVRKVAIALDPTEGAISRASELGCNVLLTHHPAYLSAPGRIVCSGETSTGASRRIFAAISSGVSLIAMHTNLDRSLQARVAISSPIGLVPEDGLVWEDPDLPSFGIRATVQEDSGITLEELAERCRSGYGCNPRVWGEKSSILRSVGICNGSSSSLISDIVLSGVDCLVTGEMSYHSAGDLVSGGVSLIELGHDISEFPLVQCLAEALDRIGIGEQDVERVEPDVYWWQLGME
jgi:dinuclear metal center YbgI/SA1388 family protein